LEFIIMIFVLSRPNNTKVEFDLTDVSKTEARIVEIAAVTGAKAPELLAAFNRAYLDCSRAMAGLEAEVAGSKRNVMRVKSRLLLDVVPGILAAKGLATAKSPMGSEDLRQAVLDSNDEYLAAQELLSKHECYLELVKGKMKGIEMAFSSVKRIVGETNYNGHKNNFSHGEIRHGGGGNGGAPPGATRGGFGTARLSNDD